MLFKKRSAITTVLALTVVVVSIGLFSWPITRQVVFRTLASLQIENNKQQAARFAHSLEQQIQHGTSPEQARATFQETLVNLPSDEAGFVCMIGPGTEITAHPNVDMLGMSMKDEKRRSFDGRAITFEASNIQNIPGGGLYQMPMGVTEIVYQLPVKGLDWLVSVHTNEDVITKRVDKIMHTLFLITLPSAILLILIGSAAVRMTSRFYEVQLEAANEQLEEKVKQRTAELQNNYEELKKTKEKLKQSEKMSFLGQLVASITHEIKNPLAVILGNAEMLSYNKELSATQAKLIRRISTASDRCSRLVKSLLSFSRKEPVVKKKWELKSILHTTIDLLETELEQSKTRLQIELAENLPHIHVDRLQMEQVFFNLMNNAIQAMHRSEKREIQIQALVSKDAICIDVEDTGPGIPEDQLKQLFNAFFTTKEQGKGTGLGLSLCQQFITAHGGYISVSSELGRGTVFHIQLPLS